MFFATSEKAAKILCASNVFGNLKITWGILGPQNLSAYHWVESSISRKIQEIQPFETNVPGVGVEQGPIFYTFPNAQCMVYSPRCPARLPKCSEINIH